jgi:hypothetical protein
VAQKPKRSTAADEPVFLVVAVDDKTVLIAPAIPAIEDARLAAKVKNFKPKRGVREAQRVLVVTGNDALFSAFGTLNPAGVYKPPPPPPPKRKSSGG